MRLGMWIVAAFLAAGCGDDGTGGGPGSGSGSDAQVGGDAGSGPDAAQSDGGTGTGGSTGGGGSDAQAGQDASGGGTPDAASGGGGPDAATAPVGTAELLDSCPTFTACGGDVSETRWHYDHVCVEKDELLGTFYSVCSEAEVEDGSGTVQGVAVFSGGSISVSVELMLMGSAHVPASCAEGVGCSGVEQFLLARPEITAATCADAAEGGCDCDATYEVTDGFSDGYTVDGNVLQTTGGRTFDFCASPFSYDETTPNAAQPGVYELVAQ